MHMSKISQIRRLHIMLCKLQTVAFGFQLDLHGGNPFAFCGLCVYLVFVFKFRPLAFVFLERSPG